MSRIVSAIEDNPFERKLTPKSPVLTYLMCSSDYGKKFPKKLTKLLKQGEKGWSKVAQEVAKEDAFSSATVGTTVAVDVINGGVKVNALPELVTTMVNFRIDHSESVGSTKKHVEKLIAKVAKQNDLKFHAWKNNTSGGRFISVDGLGAALEPAPRTPSEGPAWELFAGTVKAAFPAPDGGERIVAPFAMTGNTDCKMYYNLTKNVYRFFGLETSAISGIHTVNEKAKNSAHWGVVDWLHAIIQNVDAYSGPE